ncbi:MAG TPA: hypothetical protein DIC34_09365 [Treponema sp.]|nr:MAG: hypothetical protein A2Y36_05250 [Treponema sp. GWA1_62_8]OHE64429.1 MAG: hypothetical protein A2001_02080 [Treponema sp. GWC1_61_84]OHE76324.1 MAG: hypothetical protein A2413_16235 [Treponema sp. RIFOXYC1_FULL_61_9]HCM26736.1 hypothetical protein [Treponema sp.]
METTIEAVGPITEIAREKINSMSALRVARHFMTVRKNVGVLDLADFLQDRDDAVVIAVVDDGGTYEGLIVREKLFAFVGKPFGRDVLRRSLIAEIAEAKPAFDANADLFTIAQKVREETAGSDPLGDYFALIDGSGKFKGTLSRQDLSDYLARMTEDDIALAGRLQERILSGADLSAGHGRRMEAWSRSAKGVGGDFYYSRALADGRTFAALCDVSGKGVAAALIVSLVWGILGMYDFSRGLRGLIAALNDSLLETFQTEKYLTGFFFLFDPSRRKLIFADMGHSHVILIRGAKAAKLKGKNLNLPIGVEAQIEIAVQAVRLHPGDVLAAYSDGICEQQNEAEEEYGEGRLIKVLIEAIGRGGNLAEAIPLSVDSFRGRVPQQDDMSIIALAVG